VRGHVREVELDRPAATRLEVDEPKPAPCVEEIAGVRLAVQHLLGRPTVGDSPNADSQCVHENLAVLIGQRRSAVGISHQRSSRAASLFEFCRMTMSSTDRPCAEATDIAAAIARRASDGRTSSGYVAAAGTSDATEASSPLASSGVRERIGARRSEDTGTPRM